MIYVANCWSRLMIMMMLLITSDFPHYVREGIENGIYAGDSLHTSGIGGICVYLNGSIGGLMTTNPGFMIQDPISGQEYLEPSFEKAEAHRAHYGEGRNQWVAHFPNKCLHGRLRPYLLAVTPPSWARGP